MSCEASVKTSATPGKPAPSSATESPEAPNQNTKTLITVAGEFVPTRRIQIKSEFSGRVEDLNVAKGQLVGTENPLFRIESDPLAEKLEDQQAELQQAQAQLDLDRELLAAQGTEEEPEEEVVAERPAEETLFPTPREMEPTFSELASEVRFTPVDAGGIWPGIAPEVIADSRDPQDAGGIWPSYGAREMVNGQPYSPVQETPVYPSYFPEATNLAFATESNFPSEALPAPTPLAARTSIGAPLAVEEGEEEETTTGMGSPIEESRLALDQAKVDRIRAEIAVTESELSRRTLYSPLEGRVHDLAVSDGSPVEPGDFLLEIYEVDPIEFSFNVPKHLVDSLELGMEIKGQVSENGRSSFEGYLSFIGAELNEDKETVEVRATVDNPQDTFKVGMKGFAEIAASTKISQNTITFSFSAIPTI